MQVLFFRIANGWIVIAARGSVDLDAVTAPGHFHRDIRHVLPDTGGIGNKRLAEDEQRLATWGNSHADAILFGVRPARHLQALVQLHPLSGDDVPIIMLPDERPGSLSRGAA